MPLGVTYSNTGAELITGGGKALTDQIRLIGKEISAITQRAQTNRDVEALGAEMSSLDPNQPDYLQKLAAVAARHPMAIQSEGGQMILKSGVEANKGWMREQLLQDRLTGMTAIAGINAQGRRDVAGIQADSRLEVAQARVQGRIEEAEKRGASAAEVARIRSEGQQEVAQIRNERPVTISPGGILFDPVSGEEIARGTEKQLPDRSSGAGGLTTNQRLLSFQKDRDIAKASIEKAVSEIKKITGDDPASGKQKADLWKAIEEWKAKFDAAESEIKRIRTPVSESEVPSAPMMPVAPMGGIPNMPAMDVSTAPALDVPMMPTAPAGAKSWKSALQ